jgi:surface protein
VGLGWWCDVLHFLRVDCSCDRPSFLATVFQGAAAFNGNINQWDVAKVTTMNISKSMRIAENDLT